MPLRFAALKFPSRLYRLLPLMPAVFFVYLIVMVIPLFVLPIELFKVLFFSLLLVLIAFNLGLILQYGFTLSKLIGDSTTPKLLLASLAAIYIVMLAQIIATFFIERRAETAFTVTRLTALIGAIPVTIAIIASRSSALIAIATLAFLIAILAPLTAITLLAVAVLTGPGGTGLLQELISGLSVAYLVLLGLLTTLLFITLHSLLNQPFGLTFFLILLITNALYEDVLENVALESWSGFIVTSVLLAFTYTPGILSIVTLSWLAYRAYKATGNVDFKRVALILALEITVPFILLPQASIPVALMALVETITRQPWSKGIEEFFSLLAMTTLLLTIIQAAKWYIAIRPLEDS